MKVVFLDNCCPSSYVINDLSTKPMGGTEATVLRVGNALAQSGVDVVYEQLSPVPTTANPDVVVTLRRSSDVLIAKNRYPKARHLLWLHDVTQPGTIKAEEIVDVTVLCVSNWHLKHTLAGHSHLKNAKVVYNPIEDSLYAIRCTTDQNKLVFFSSPHKGLQATLGTFFALSRGFPDLKLFVANPGYIKMNPLSMPGVIDVGPIPHAQIMGHVSQAYCVLYDNTVFPETFGLVMAEANALGVPVLTHPIGAAPEVLFHPSEYEQGSIAERFVKWKSGSRPSVKGKDPFKMSSVLARWKRLLEG